MASESDAAGVGQDDGAVAVFDQRPAMQFLQRKVWECGATAERLLAQGVEHEIPFRAGENQHAVEDKIPTPGFLVASRENFIYDERIL